MKTRIRVEEKADGSYWLYPQYKGWFFWHSYWNYGWDGSLGEREYFTSLDGAEEFLKERIKEYRAEKTVKIYHRSYP